MNCPDRNKAEEIFEEVIRQRNLTPFPFTDQWEQSYREHCGAVARFAETIAAKCPGMDGDTAYVMGLLHDAGRIVDEPNTKQFHGLVGYNYLSDLGYPDLARISITHCFVEKDFDMSTYPHAQEDLLRCKELLKDWEYDDYDLLLQLTDLINDMGKACTIEYRFDSISKRYKVPAEKLEPMINKLNEIKTYFDSKCGGDIYDLLGIGRNDERKI